MSKLPLEFRIIRVEHLQVLYEVKERQAYRILAELRRILKKKKKPSKAKRTFKDDYNVTFPELCRVTDRDPERLRLLYNW